MRVIAALVMALGLIAAPVGADEGYVPEPKSPENEEYVANLERRYGNQLHAMGEPPIATVALAEGFRERFRLTVLPTFSHGFAVRIDSLIDGTVRLRWAILDGYGGYDPGSLAKSEERLLEKGEEEVFRKAFVLSDLRQAYLRDLPTAELNIVTIDDCLDGTTYVFEQVNDSEASFVDKGCHLDEPLNQLKMAIYSLIPEDVSAQDQ